MGRSFVLAWVAVGLFWFFATRRAHPTLGLAIVTTTALVSACALASAINQDRLIPRYWAARRYLAYAGRLLAVMASLTAAALLMIRVSYTRTLGPDPDPNGVYVHYAIDFLGVVAHVAASAFVARLVRRRSGARGEDGR